MKKIPIALIAVIVVLAFVGGYFTGLLNSAGNFTLNVTNQTNDTGSNYDDSGTTYQNTKTTTKTNTQTTTPTETASSSSSDTSTPTQTDTPTEPTNSSG